MPELSWWQILLLIAVTRFAWEAGATAYRMLWGIFRGIGTVIRLSAAAGERSTIGRVRPVTERDLERRGTRDPMRSPTPAKAAEDKSEEAGA